MLRLVGIQWGDLKNSWKKTVEKNKVIGEIHFSEGREIDMLGKLSFESIANRFAEAYSSLQGIAKGQISNFFTPGFNSATGQQAAIKDLTRKFIEGQAEPQQEDFTAKAKELIDKYMPKNVLLVGKFNSQGLGAELATLVPKGAKLGDAIFAELVPGDKCV